MVESACSRALESSPCARVSDGEETSIVLAMVESPSSVFCACLSTRHERVRLVRSNPASAVPISLVKMDPSSVRLIPFELCKHFIICKMRICSALLISDRRFGQH